MTEIHDLADVASDQIGEGTRIWQFVVVLENASIGSNCNICSHVFIENDVTIGDNVTIKNGARLWDGVRVENNVFIGPNVTFTNDKFPRSKHHDKEFEKTTVKRGASLGANATILPGLVIGENSMVGAGAVVTHDVPPNAIVAGNPAVISGYVDTKVQIQQQATTNSTLTTSAVAGVSLTRLKSVSDLRGDLSVTDVESEIPFRTRRVFWVYNVPSEKIRGAHVHRKLHEFVVCVSGSVSVVVDDGVNREEFLLDEPSLGLHLPPMVWRSLYRYTSDAVLLVFASSEYDPDDYVRDYDRFLKLVK
jgi:acetyltransferase-like isoleucine patch superfamily enzyme/dTDP-4-dehydrorhamnose 3,5-epimerase-like enzyme